MLGLLAPLAAFALQLGGPVERDPRTLAREVAETIASNYYDEEKGATIAAGLTAEIERGTFDAFRDPSALAGVLTARLNELDGHFGVEWKMGGRGDEVGTPPRAVFAWEEVLKRTGNGFRRVEILAGNIGYVEMSNFAPIDFADPADEARRSADSALALIADTDAIVIDLRRNGGGAPSMVGYLVSAFVGPEKDVYNRFVTRDGSFSEEPALTYPSPREEAPLYLLTSASTGSAAEAFPYTLQAAGRALVIGEATSGAANPGNSFRTPSGMEVFVSTGAPINPSTHTNWEGTGVKPDIVVPSDAALRHAHELALEQIGTTETIRRDTEWALDALRASYTLTPDEAAAYTGEFGTWNVRAERGGLVVTRPRRHVDHLVPIGRDLFFVRSDPMIRYRFLPGVSGYGAIERSTAYGSLRRMSKEVE